MVNLTNDMAKKNSNILMQRAMQRRHNLCSPNSMISARQTTQRFVPRTSPFGNEQPKIKIDSPKICKPHS